MYLDVEIVILIAFFRIIYQSMFSHKSDKPWVMLELLDLEGVITNNTSPECEAKSLMMGYPLFFLQEGVHSNKL